MAGRLALVTVDNLPFPQALCSAMFGVVFLPEENCNHTYTHACMHIYTYIYLYILSSCFSTEQSERAPGNAPVDAKVMKAAGWKNALSEFILTCLTSSLLLVQKLF